MAASSAQLRSWWAGYSCSPSKFDTVSFAGDGRVWSLPVASPSAPAWRLFVRAQTESGYWFRESAGGTYNCRNIAGKPYRSLHAYGIALDINPLANPQRSPLTHNYPAKFIKLVEGIRTKNGKQVFAWGGRWTGVTPDAMHWQINCSPADLATGLVYPSAAPPVPPTPSTIPVGVDMAEFETIAGFKFYDVAKWPSWADLSIRDAIDSGVIQGKQFTSDPKDRLFDPNGSLTRAEAAVMLRRAGVLK